MAWGYGRASLDETIQAHTKEAQEAAVLAYWEVFLKPKGIAWGGLHFDRAVTGKKEIAKRPEGHSLEKDLYSGDVVIMARLDRGFRNAVDALQTIDRWASKDVSAVFLDMQVDTRTPAGRAFLTIVAAFAEMERSYIVERTKAGLKARQDKGLHVGNQPCLYRWRGERKKKKLVLDPYLVGVAENIVNWRKAGYSFGEITAHLLQCKIYRENGRTFSKTAIRRMVTAYEALTPEQLAGVGQQKGSHAKP